MVNDQFQNDINRILNKDTQKIRKQVYATNNMKT